MLKIKSADTDVTSQLCCLEINIKTQNRDLFIFLVFE